MCGCGVAIGVSAIGEDACADVGGAANDAAECLASSSYCRDEHCVLESIAVEGVVVCVFDGLGTEAAADWETTDKDGVQFVTVIIDAFDESSV